MVNRIFNSPTTFLLNKSMDAAALKNTVIADNISNVNTPNFKKREVVFQEKLNSLLNNQRDNIDLAVTHKRHIIIKSKQDLEAEIRQNDDWSFKNDGNNVDIDVESAKLAQNKIEYDVLSQSINNELKLLRLAISGRG